MNIKGIGNSGIGRVAENIKRNKDVKAPNMEVGTKISDSIEISAEAKVKQMEIENAQKLEVVRERIASDYYNSEEVIQKVAEEILKEVSAE